jgi:hypothetical protein
LNGRPIVIGDGNFSKYALINDIACCNADGIAFENSLDSEVIFFKDQNAKTTLGANQILVVAPGSSVPFFFNENTNIEASENSPNGGYVQHITIPDPVYPFSYDFDLIWDECDKKWTYYISVWFDLFNTFQPDAFKESPFGSGDSPADELFGVTGIFKYLVT